MLSTKQRHFLTLFVSDGEFDFFSTCMAADVLPSLANAWFHEKEFKQQLRKYEHAKLLSMGYGPLRVVRDTMAIAHSDITKVQVERDKGLEALPRDTRIAIKKIEYGALATLDGDVKTYVKRVEMHSKDWALKQAGDWYNVAEAPEVKSTQETESNDGPARIAGLIVRPPLSNEDKEIEDLLS